MHKPGYILMTTLSMIAIAVALVTYLFNRGMLFIPTGHTLIAREKAKMLALSGISIARAQLAVPIKQEKKEQNTLQKPQEGNQDAQEFFARVFPVINQWQKFPLQESVDGVTGEIGIRITCQEGKINLNAIYDFSKHEFISEKTATGLQKILQVGAAGKEKSGESGWKKLLQELCGRIDQEAKTKNLFQSLEQYLKKRHYPLDDVTQLFEIADNGVLLKKTMRYEFPQEKEQNKEKGGSFCLTDIFTVDGGQNYLEPWLLSDSLSTLLGLKPLSQVIGGEKKASVKEIVKRFKPTASWKTEWNTLLQPMYGKELQTLPESIDSFFTKTFDPRTFMVLSYGVVDKVTVRACALVARVAHNEGNQKAYKLIVKKLYWI